jgi:peptidoglycan-N-acetylmuramic acid deacetylase
MRHAASRVAALAAAGAAAFALAAAAAQPSTALPASAPAADAAAPCPRPVYLTFDTGHMGVAPLVADVLRRHGVKATFFLADERTQTDGTSLDDHWAPWWRERAAEGHLFGSHTFDHVVWRADLPGHRFRVRPTAGPRKGQVFELSAQEYCEELQRPAQRFKAMTGQDMAPLFRAPAGRTSAALLRAARGCGFAHVPWTAAGFLGDELPSDRYPNDVLLKQALQNIRAGDILLAHLGIWSRQDPWAPAVLEPLVAGLQQRGLCFATLREHPKYAAWLGTARAGAAPLAGKGAGAPR